MFYVRVALLACALSVNSTLLVFAWPHLFHLALAPSLLAQLGCLACTLLSAFQVMRLYQEGEDTQP